MARSHVQSSFVSGELDALLFSRGDVQAYYNGAASLQNVLVLPQGGVRRRPGLEHILKLPNVLTRVTGQTITAPQGGSTTQSNDDDESTSTTSTADIGTTDPYVLVHYDLTAPKTIKYADVVDLLLNGSDSPTTDEFEIQYSTDDAAWNTFESALLDIDGTARRQRKGFSAVTARYWRLAKVGGTDPGGTGTITASVAEFSLWEESSTLSNCRLVSFAYSTEQEYMLAFTDRNAMVLKDGARLTDARTSFTSAQLASINWTQSQDTLLVAHKSVPLQRLLRGGTVEGDWQMDAWPFTFVPKYNFIPDVQSPAKTLTPSAVEGVINLTAGSSEWVAGDVNQIVEGNGGKARIVSVTSGTVAVAVTLIPFFNTDAIASGDWTIDRGYEDVWSATRGYPNACAFYEGRLHLGNSLSRPQTWWASRVDDFFSFDTGQGLDDEAIDFTLDADEVNQIVNIFPGRNLQFLTTAAEWYAPQALGVPLTPANAAAIPQTRRGSRTGLRAAEVDGGTLFVQRGGKAVREFLFSDSEQAYSARNLSLRSSQVISDPVDFALRKATSTDEGDYILLVNSDGTAAACATLRAQNVTAWSRLSTPSGSFKAVGVEGGDGDMWWAVEREIDGIDGLYLERFNEAFLMDAAKQVAGASSTMSGLDHLEGETVGVRVDGKVLGDEVVASGQVTFDEAAANLAEVGLAWYPVVTTMPFTDELPDGSSVGKRVRVIRSWMRVYQTSNLVFNGEQIPLTAFGEVPGSAPPLATGILESGIRLGYNTNGQVTFTQNAPHPFHLLGVNLRVSV